MGLLEKIFNEALDSKWSMFWICLVDIIVCSLILGAAILAMIGIKEW